MSADASTAENGDADRRRPQQQRSRAKVDALLDATDELLAAEGAAAVTTTAVTERAGVAVGTLYQYFAGVDALLGAVGERHASRIGIRLARSLRDRRLTRKRDAANLALDTLIEYARETPAFRALWSAPSVRRDAGQGVSSAAEPLVQLVATALVDQGLGEADDPGFDLEVQIQWAVAEGLIRLAFDRDPGGDPVVLAHLRRLWDLDVELG
ncbi:MAG: TetR family transcriptional regulator [Acidimicrobiales bacterium]